MHSNVAITSVEERLPSLVGLTNDRNYAAALRWQHPAAISHTNPIPSYSCSPPPPPPLHILSTKHFPH